MPDAARGSEHTPPLSRVGSNRTSTLQTRRHCQRGVTCWGLTATPKTALWTSKRRAASSGHQPPLSIQLLWNQLHHSLMSRLLWSYNGPAGWSQQGPHGSPWLKYLPSGPKRKRFANPCPHTNASLSTPTTCQALSYALRIQNRPAFVLTDSCLLGNERKDEQIRKAVVSPCQKQGPGQRTVTVEGLSPKRAAREGDIYLETWRKGRSFTTAGKPRISIVSKLSINTPQTKCPPSPISTNICFLPMAEKFYINHSLFPTTHTHKLIQYGFI